MNKNNHPETDLSAQKSQQVIYTGAISCKAVLENRPDQADELFVNKEKRSKDITYIISLAKRNGIPVSLLSKQQMKEHFENSGGIALKACPKPIPALDMEKKAEGLVIYLSGVEDPHNLGSSIRSLYAAGCSMVIISRRDWSFANPVICRASAGAFEKMAVLSIGSEEELIEYKLRQNVPMFCASRKDPVSLFDYHFKADCIGVIGGALRGISGNLEDACDARICIPYGNDFRNALDTPSAAAVFAFSWLRDNPDRIRSE